MAAVNKVILLGNLGRDPELRHSPEGGAVTSISVATTESWKDKEGKEQEKTEWHRVSFFGKLAEVVGEHLRTAQLRFHSASGPFSCRLRGIGADSRYLKPCQCSVWPRISRNRSIP